MKKLILITLSLITFNANSSDAPYRAMPQDTVKFGTGVVTKECWHEEIATGAQDRYAFTTDNYGNCPVLDSHEYINAYRIAYGQLKDHIPAKVLYHREHHKTLNPAQISCRDDGYHFDPMY